jgi:ATP-binding cassette subfamily C (CFTR/MRP) protein 1
MESVANALVFLASILTAAQHGHINAALAGMAVSYTLTVTQSLNWFVRMVSDFETNVVSVERIDEYAHGIEPEASLETGKEPPPQWPQKGEIVLRDVVARYREDLDDVLRGVTFTIPATSHIGVCGKTGCGKSTMFLVLLRIVEPRSGVILIDGVDTKEIGLRRLRECISIIPQDAVLFNTTLRYNLDPTGKKSDAEIWHALEISELSEFVKRTMVSPTNPSLSPLDMLVSEGGGDFSFGQRQLMCIARALLRDSKILLSDEASSGIDRITDGKIQDMIKREFASRTTVTIAHRLETIRGCDYIALMDGGVVAEFDDPKVLLENRNARFFRLANDLSEEVHTLE